MNSIAFDQTKKKEYMVRTGFSMGITFVVTFTLAFSILFIMGDSTIAALGNSFVFSVVMMINTLILSLISNDNVNYYDDYSKFFKSTQALFKVFVILLTSLCVGYYSLNALKNGLNINDDDFEVDELSMVFSVSGIFLGISNTFFYIFLDSLYIRFFCEAPKEGDIQVVSLLVGKQTFISFFINFVIFVFALITVKVYVFFLKGFGLDLRIFEIPFELVDLMRYVMVLLLFSFSGRFSFKFLAYEMSLQ